MISIISCKSNKHILKNSVYTQKFDYLNVKKEFEMKLSEFYPNTAYCGTEGLPYALLIGKPTENTLPKRISVLSYCDNRIFKIGEILKIKPTENPTKKTTMNPIYLVKDTIINGIKKRWLLGSENKVIWGIPNLKEKDCELNNGKYKVVYDKQFSEYPKFEFEVHEQNLTEINSKSNRSYKIVKIGENSFRLIPLEKQTDSLTKFQKKIALNGKPYYEITGCSNNMIEFIMRVNLHVISHSGKFVRIDLKK